MILKFYVPLHSKIRNKMNSKFFYRLNSFNEHIFKCFILGICIIPFTLFAQIDKSKDKNKNKDTVISSFSQDWELRNLDFKDSLFTPEQMREDFLYFYEKILATHPNPYYLIGKDSMDKKVQEIRNSLDKPMNRMSFWLKIATLNACFDGHTRIEKIGEIYYRKNFKIGILNEPTIMSDYLGNLYFNPDYGDTLLAGKHIKSVNGINGKEIFDKISTYDILHYKQLYILLYFHHILILLKH